MPTFRSWFPDPESDQVIWLTNYKGKIPTHGPTCGISAPELTDTDADLAYYIWLLGTWNPAIQQDAQEATIYKRLIATGTGDEVALPEATVFTDIPPVRPPGVLTRVFNQIARMKKNAGFTDPIAADLRVMPVPDTSEHPYPAFTLKVAQAETCQCVHLNFPKHGHEGVYIESRRNNGAWEFLAIDTLKPYDDERPLLVANTAETREYRMRWWDKSEPNGDWSPVQRVTVGA